MSESHHVAFQDEKVPPPMTATEAKLKPSLTSKEVKRMIKQKEKDELFKVLMNN